MYIVRLTPNQHAALMSVLLDRARDQGQDATRVWIDVTNDSQVTIEDLLSLVDTAATDAPQGPRYLNVSY